MENKTRDVSDMLDNFLVMTGCCDRPEIYDKTHLFSRTMDTGSGISLLGTKPEDIGCFWNVKVTSNSCGRFYMSEYRSVSALESMLMEERLGENKFKKFNYVSEVIEHDMNKDGSVTNSNYYMGYKNNWKLAFDPDRQVKLVGDNAYVSKFPPHEKKRMTDKIDMVLGYLYMLPSLWTTSVSIHGSPSIIIPTDPIGVRQIWALRDLPAGKSRRSALLHWVSNHWRQDRSDSKCETYVREHMRGNTQFETHGIKVSVTESKEDSVRLIKAIQDRNTMKRRRMDRRRKSR